MFATLLSAIRTLRHTGSTGSRSRNTRSSLSIETLEDRFMPSSTPTFTLTPVSQTQINVAWNSVPGATSYQVDEWVNNSWMQVANLGSAATHASVTGLLANTGYWLDVIATSGTSSTWGAPLHATTQPFPPAYTATAVSPTQVDLSWTPYPGALGYQVIEFANGAWQQPINMSTSSTSYQYTGLTPGTSYAFNVGVITAGGFAWGTPAGKSVTTPKATTISEPAVAAGLTYTNATGSLFGINGPSYLDVHQGQVGDCWLMSSLASVAARDPQDITSMFTSAGTAVENGSVVNLYSVRFYTPTGQAEYVTVDTELPSGGAYYARPVNGVLWVAMAEKAFAEANGAGYVVTSHTGIDSYAALDGGFGYWGEEAITGKQSVLLAGINPTTLATAWNAGDPLVIGSSSTPANPYILGNPQAGTHAYAIVGYNPSSSTPFEVYNPWGTTSVAVSGGAGVGTAYLSPGLEPYGSEHQDFGLFWASGTFLEQNYANQSIGTGAVAANNSLATGIAVAEAGLNTTPRTPDVSRTAQPQTVTPHWNDALWAEMGNRGPAHDEGRQGFVRPTELPAQTANRSEDVIFSDLV
jgi:hypothetical protein